MPFDINELLITQADSTSDGMTYQLQNLEEIMAARVVTDDLPDRTKEKSLLSCR